MPPKASSSTNAVQNASNAISPDHLSHPERWATGAEPATEAQVGFIGVLENQKHLEVGEERKAEMGKSEASEIIDGLKHGRVLPPSEVDAPGAPPPTDTKRKRDTDAADKGPSESKATDSKTDEEDEKKDADEEKKEDAIEGKGDGKGEEKAEEKKESNGDSDTSKPVKKSTSTSKASTSIAEDTPSAPKKAKISPSKSTTSDNTPKEPSSASDSTSNEDGTEQAKSSEDASKNGGKEVPNLPGDAAAPSEDHLAHPESWATGDDPATEKQLGYIAVLEKKNGGGSAKDHENLGKSEASELIEELKGGQ